jgi:8-oxo-dGTP diphosphatase
VNPDETPEAALARELEEELSIHARIGPEIERYPYQYPGRDPILLLFFRVSDFDGEPVNRAFSEITWAAPDRLADYDFLAGDRAFLRRYAAP